MLQELCKLAEREQLVGDPAFEVKPVAWIIELTADGELIGGFAGTHQPIPLPENKKVLKKGKPKEEVKRFTVPRQTTETGGTRTSGDYAYFLVDKSDYVLGCAIGTKAHQPPTERKLLNRHSLFIDRVRDCYKATGERKIEAVLKFLERVHVQGLPVDLPEKMAVNDLFAFIVRPDIEDFIHDLPSVQNYWRTLCAGSSVNTSSGWQCLITGRPMEMPALFPLVKNVPGAQSQSGLVSFNKPAFESYGWKSNANASVSSEAAQAASVAMNRLLDPAFQRQDGQVLQRRNIRLGPDTVACYWAAENAGDDTASSLRATLHVDLGGKPGELWQAVWRGQMPPRLDPSKFYAVTLSGAQGRAIVRDWYETTVGEVQASVIEYFNQLKLFPNTFPAKGNAPLPPYYGLPLLQQCLTVSGKADDLPSKYTAELFAAAINQQVKFPSALLSIALERMRAEATHTEWIASHRRDARIALIKAILVRNHQLNLCPTMDDNNDKYPAYLLGRLFACVERMQYLALGDQVNANIANRYFAAASTTPRFIFNALLRDLEGHYLKKAKRKKPGAAVLVHREICRIQDLYKTYAEAGEGYPERLHPKEQGLFMIGYHIQRGEYLHKKARSEDSVAPAADPGEGEDESQPEQASL